MNKKRCKVTKKKAIYIINEINFIREVAASQIYLLLLHQNKQTMHTREEKLEAFGKLLDVLDRLREECPWDRKQTNESLRPNTIEETFELCDALM